MDALLNICTNMNTVRMLQHSDTVAAPEVLGLTWGNESFIRQLSVKSLNATLGPTNRHLM